MTSPRVFHYDDMRVARAFGVLAGLVALAVVVMVPPLVMAGGPWLFAAAVLVIVAAVSLAGATFHADDAGLFFAGSARRTFWAVCRSNGLTVKPLDGTDPLYPRFDRFIGTRDAWQARIRPVVGQKPADFERAAPGFSLAYGSRAVRFIDNGDGTLTIRCGQHGSSVVATVLPTLDPAALAEGQNWRDVLSAVPVANRLPAGGRYGMPVIDTQTLVAGVTGAGKGSVIWSLLINLLPAIHAGVVKVAGLDPKRNELSIGKNFFNAGYANTDEAMLVLLNNMVKEMQRRADVMAGKVRKFIPTPDMPLIVVVVDELAYLTSYVTDRKKRDEIGKLLQTLLSQGRSAGIHVFACVQDPRVETVPFRDLFPTRVGMKLPAGMIDIILGPGSKEAGAACDQIRRKVDAGMAYVISEDSDAPELVRFDWSDDDTIMAAAVTLPNVA
jgi:S-DNA-T family DNA segregation ATPase FtsK/SpoIIIE